MALAGSPADRIRECRLPRLCPPAGIWCESRPLPPRVTWVSRHRQNDGVQADPARSEIRISIVMFALTVTAGAVDAVTFLGLGRAFAALATGNVLLLGFGVANAPGISIARPADALAAFAAGVAAAHAVIVPVSGRGRRWYVIALVGEVAVVAGAGLYAVIVSGTRSLPAHAQAIVVVLLAAAMGGAAARWSRLGSRTCRPQWFRSVWSRHSWMVWRPARALPGHRCWRAPVGPRPSPAFSSVG
jgi:Protein of unknown function (DUF1275)